MSTQIFSSGAAMARAFRGLPKVARRIEQRIVVKCAEEIWPDILGVRVDTNTYRASMTPVGPGGQARKLPVRRGHPTPGEAEARQVVRRRKTGDEFAVLNRRRSANHIEERWDPHVFEETFRHLDDAGPRLVPEAVMEEVRR